MLYLIAAIIKQKVRLTLAIRAARLARKPASLLEESKNLKIGLSSS
jgi:hypothetical protein